MYLHSVWPGRCPLRPKLCHIYISAAPTNTKYKNNKTNDKTTALCCMVSSQQHDREKNPDLNDVNYKMKSQSEFTTGVCSTHGNPPYAHYKRINLQRSTGCSRPRVRDLPSWRKIWKASQLSRSKRSSWTFTVTQSTTVLQNHVLEMYSTLHVFDSLSTHDVAIITLNTHPNMPDSLVLITKRNMRMVWKRLFLPCNRGQRSLK